jgi:predicted RNA-binding Zn ribbon-like protein
MDLGYGPPEERPPAPAPLDRVQEFINTRVNMRDTGEIRDELSSPASLRDWMSARGLIHERSRVNQADLDRTVVVREGLRALLARHNDAVVAADDEAIRALDEVAATLPLRMSVRGESDPMLVPAAEPGVDHALATFLAHTVTARAEGVLARLKACRDLTCRWVFFDSSKNRSGTWCSMASCGSASKKRHFSERRRQQRRTSR